MKIIKNYKQLSKLKRRQLYNLKNNDDKRSSLIKLDPKFAVSIARQISTDFENIDLRKKPTKGQYQKARKIIDLYFSANSKNSSKIRPSKENRKLYSEYTGLPKSFKVFPVSLTAPNNKIKISKKGKRKYIKQTNKFVVYDDYLFESQKDLAKSPKREANKLKKKIEKEKKQKDINAKIIVGNYTTTLTFLLEEIPSELERYSVEYSNFQKWVRGIRVMTFKNQVKRKGKRK